MAVDFHILHTIGNIRIHHADYSPFGGEITFTTVFTRRKYRVTLAMNGVRIYDLDSPAPHEATTERTADDVLTIIRQGDPGMWTWATFRAMWQGFVAGFGAGRDYQDTRIRQRLARKAQADASCHSPSAPETASP